MATASQEFICATVLVKCKKYLLFQYNYKDHFHKSNPESEKGFWDLLSEVDALIDSLLLKYTSSPKMPEIKEVCKIENTDEPSDMMFNAMEIIKDDNPLITSVSSFTAARPTVLRASIKDREDHNYTRNDNLMDQTRLVDAAQFENMNENIVTDSQNREANKKPVKKSSKHKNTALFKKNVMSKTPIVPFPIYTCAMCKMEFGQKKSLYGHMSDIHGVKVRPYKCDMCEKSFRTNSTRKEHRKIHTGEKPFTCSFCQKKFVQASGMRDHIRIHTGEKPFICKFCPDKFSHRTGLKSHTRRKHTLERPFLCDLCPKSFPVAGSLTEHMRRHTGEKRYSCDQCPIKFVDSGGLARHKKIHRGIKSFTCDECGAMFYEGYNLRSHVQRMHTAKQYLTMSIVTTDTD